MHSTVRDSAGLNTQGAPEVQFDRIAQPHPILQQHIQESFFSPSRYRRESSLFGARPSHVMDSSGDAEAVASLDRVLDRLAATDEAHLEVVLSRLLAPLVLRLAPGVTPAVQSRVLGILSHINKRVKEREVVGLPVPDLLEQLQTSPAFTGNFLAIYVKLGAARLAPAVLSGLLPRLLSFRAFPPHARDLVARAALLALPHASIGGSGALSTRFGSLLSESTPSSTTLTAAALLGQVMLYTAVPRGNQAVRGGAPAERVAVHPVDTGPPAPQPGVSAHAASLVGVDFEGAVASSELVALRKRGVLALLSTPGLLSQGVALAVAVAGPCRRSLGTPCVAPCGIAPPPPLLLHHRLR